MFYAVRHITRFRYAEPIRESLMEVIMQPRSEGPQRLISFSFAPSPRAQVLAYNDHLGNIVHHFDILRSHRELTIEAQSQVELRPTPDLPERVDAGAWGGLAPERLGHEEFDMLSDHGITAPTALLQDFMTQRKLERQSDPLTTVRAISKTIHEAFDYDSEATEVDSPIDHALGLQRGVCQDFSHIMIAATRRLGIPARYVSGYLHHRRELDSRPAPGATHAWVEAFVPGLGWTGFDPTNGVLAGERHIRVGIGRDYDDVPPTRGTFKGKPKSELAVAVTVQPADAPMKPADLFKVSRSSTQMSVDQASPDEHASQQQQ
jgi:transglutaminase-like putative cysteine protease